MFIVDLFEADLLEAGAGSARIVHHVQEGAQFIVLSAFRKDLPYAANRKRDARLKHILKGLPVSYIPVEGEYTMAGEDQPSPEHSYFIMPAKEWSPQSLMMIGHKLGNQFEQESIVYGDGEMVWLVFASGEKMKLGNRLTFRPEIIDRLGGSSTLKNRKFSFTNYQKAKGAATYNQRNPPKKLDKVRQLP